LSSRIHNIAATDFGTSQRLQIILAALNFQKEPLRLGVVAHAYNCSHLRGISKRKRVQDSLGKNVKLYLKNSQSKKGLGSWLKWRTACPVSLRS
jgi:hypothetical protein